MNKIIVLLLAALFSAVGNSASAQTSDKAVLLNASTIGADRAAVKATRDLWARVGDKKNEAWYKLPKGYLATFEEEGVESRHVYDQKGYWMYSMMTYQEDHLPAEVRKEVKSNYYDYSIGWVKEVKEGEDNVYVVHVENKTEWKDLSVRDGEIRVLKAFCKQ
ncbi:MAG TPA: hypothetical protein VL727_00400 [Puia sp.]|jgi:hypothetical protein|nr:hypothetical protein [Puia sp.]